MGELRSAIRALALIGMSPARLLETLDASTERHKSGLMTTVAYVDLRPDERRAVYAVAGHPPPLLWDSGGPLRSSTTVAPHPSERRSHRAVTGRRRPSRSPRR